MIEDTMFDNDCYAVFMEEEHEKEKRVSDLISRQAAIDVIDAVFPVNPMKSEYAQGIACGAALAKTYVEQLPSAQPATNCSEFPNNSDTISRQAAIEWCLEGLNNMPSAEPKTDEENELKFYYVESIDDYWIGQRLDNFYYADWHECLGFVWSKSRYLPWGEHIVNENTLWKEHTYPSEPIEIPFTEWIVGFLEKYSTDRPTGEWIHDGYDFPHGNDWIHCSVCGKRGINVPADLTNFCPNCGAKMVREDGEE